MVPPCLYRISIPLHLMITESPFPIKGHSRVVFGSFRAGYSHQMYPSLSSFRTYSSCQRVIFFTCNSVYHRNQICQDLFAVIFRVRLPIRRSSRFLSFMVPRFSADRGQPRRTLKVLLPEETPVLPPVQREFPGSLLLPVPRPSDTPYHFHG